MPTEPELFRARCGFEPLAIGYGGLYKTGMNYTRHSEGIDQDIDQSVERLFALLRIASVSTDPAFKDQCRAAAEHMAADLSSIGFETSVRPTASPEPLSVCTSSVLFFSLRQRACIRRAWQHPKLDHEQISR